MPHEHAMYSSFFNEELDSKTWRADAFTNIENLNEQCMALKQGAPISYHTSEEKTRMAAQILASNGEYGANGEDCAFELVKQFRSEAQHTRRSNRQQFIQMPTEVFCGNRSTSMLKDVKSKLLNFFNFCLKKFMN